MKIPKFEKDRTLTRRTVKGAAGGMKGVDYEDDRRPDAAAKIGSTAAEIQKLKREHIRTAINEAAGAARAAAAAEAHEAVKPASAPKEEQEMILDDEDATSRDTKARQKRRPVVSRDRFTVDKDAPDLRRKVRWDLLSEEEEDEEDLDDEEESTEVDFGAIADAIRDGASYAYLYEPHQIVAPGTPGIMMPDEIQAAFHAPLDYAKHCMLLAESFAKLTGAHRHETVRYLASLFVGLSDVRFGRRALLAWGPDTGILDVYPLEVIEFVLETLPAFLPRVRFGRWIAPELGETPEFELTASPDIPLLMTVDESMVVKGFAIKGGGRPGYCFEPGPSLSTYALTIEQPGRYNLLMSARTPSGDTLVDRLQVRILGAATGIPTLTTPRDEAQLAAWPMPEIPLAVTVHEDEDDGTLDTATEEKSGINRHELARRRQLDALGGPKGEAADPIFGVGQDAARAPLRSGVEAKPGPLMPLEAPEDAWLSAAEAAVLRLALAAGATMADVQIAGADPADGDAITEVLPAWPDTAVEPAYDAPAAAAAMAELAQRALDEETPSRLGRASTEDFADAEASDLPSFNVPKAASPAGKASRGPTFDDAADIKPARAGRPPINSAAQPETDDIGAQRPRGHAATERPTRDAADRPPATNIFDRTSDEAAEKRPAAEATSAPPPGETAGQKPPGNASSDAVKPAPFALTQEEIAAGPPTLPDVPSVPPTDPADVGAHTIPDAPAVVGRPQGVVSGTQVELPGDHGLTARIDLVLDLVDGEPEEPAADIVPPPPKAPNDD